ncbi:MAG: hypothetical protein KDA96_06375 [Planctomycetaceae bacterium]|nr:hypothetical protein [Planctomycetaceae bacterium]
MTNTNCLENLACPKCGNDDCLRIAVTAVATVTDDGAEVTGAIDWHDRSFATCPCCGHDGTVGDFRIPAPDKHLHRPDLPPDPEDMNERRSKWADAAIRVFRNVTGTDEEDALGDLLADLMHWSDRNQYDFEAALFRARDHYEAETCDPAQPIANR